MQQRRTKVQTVDEDLVWIFAAVDHCDAASVGIHVTKVGNRFAALEPISQGGHEQFGSVEADAGRGLSLRIDHGSQYTSDDFRAQIKFWGMTPSYAFVAEPQTNGVAERFNRTMKEQAIHGRLFNNVEVRSCCSRRVQGPIQSRMASRKTGLQDTPRSPSGTALAT
ncbi:MAG: hypothetical protein VB135_04215 [Burkholderia sp.]